MVQAILAGRKTQTRRIAKCLLPGEKNYIFCESSEEWTAKRAKQCPYGKIGDRLWVREGLVREAGIWFYRATGTPFQLDRSRATEAIVWAHHKQSDYCPSIHMPRWASRISLEITKLRVERLQDISEEDAIAEGVKICPNMNGHANNPGYVWPDSAYDKSGLCHSSSGTAFWEGWSIINGQESWEANPWIWVVSFKQVKE